MASTMTSLHSLGQDDQNEVQHDCLGHVIPLGPVYVSHDVSGSINIITAFVTLRWLKPGAL